MRLINADDLLTRLKMKLDPFIPNDPTKHMTPTNSLKSWGLQQAIVMVQDADTIQSSIVPCNYVEACNKATMNSVTSAIVYMNVLEELKKHGYVLVDMGEVEV